MYSSVGQIVGLIEIEAGIPEAEANTALDVECGLAADGDDASLGDLFARLAGRLSTRSCPAISAPGADAKRSTNRLTIAAAPSMLNVAANLAQLKSDLTDQAALVRLRLNEARQIDSLR